MARRADTRATPAAPRWQRHLAVVLLCLFFVGLYATTLRSLGMLGWDESEYASLGRSVLRGEGFSISGRPNSLRPPLLPLAVAASLLVTGGGSDVAAKLPNLVFSALALLVVYAVLARERDRLTGWIAAAFLGLMPTFWLFTPMLLTEIPFMAFFTAAIACFYFGLYRDERFFYVSWISVALALLSRYTAVLFGPIALVFTLMALTAADARQRIRRWHFWLSPFSGLGLLLPWLLRQQLVFGNALVGFQHASGQLQAYMPEVSMPWYFYPAHVPGMVSPLLCAPLLVGIVWAVRTRDRFALHCLFVVGFVLLWFSAYRFKEVRMATSTLPFLAMVAALGVTQGILPRWPRRRVLGGVAVFLGGVFALSFFTTHRFFSRAVTLGYPSFVEAMRAVRERTAPNTVLMGASVPQIFWYADRDVIDFPDEKDLPSALKRCEWVVVVNFERGQKPYVRQLLAKVTREDGAQGNAFVSRDGRFSTVLIRASLLRQRL